MVDADCRTSGTGGPTYGRLRIPYGNGTAAVQHAGRCAMHPHQLTTSRSASSCNSSKAGVVVHKEDGPSPAVQRCGLPFATYAQPVL